MPPGNPTEAVHVAYFPDGLQILIWTWADGTMTAARRKGSNQLWGPPVDCELRTQPPLRAVQPNEED